MKLRKNRPLLLVDIAVPRDINPEVNLMPNVFLYNIDDLQAIADDYLKQRKEEVAKCERIIFEKAKHLMDIRGTTSPADVPCSVFRDSKSKGSA
jgi:glutamyl-tRNA reductase